MLHEYQRCRDRSRPANPRPDLREWHQLIPVSSAQDGNIARAAHRSARDSENGSVSGIESTPPGRKVAGNCQRTHHGNNYRYIARREAFQQCSPRGQ